MDLSLKQRLLSAAVVVALVMAAAFRLPAIWVCFVLVAISTVAVIEFYRLLDSAGIPSFRVLGALSGASLIFITWCSLVTTSVTGAYDWEFFVLFGIVIAVLVRFFPQKNNEQPLATIACTLLGILYVPFLFNFLTKLVFSWGTPSPMQPVSSTGRFLFFYLLAVVKLTDVGAYFTGRKLGRHKLFPRISPKKTWEGFFGGIFAGVVASLLFFAFTRGSMGMLTMKFHDAFLLGMLLPFMGTVGDLTESMLKRAAGCKDSGSILPGMGGFLDVLDSLLFAAPTLFIYARLFLDGTK